MVVEAEDARIPMSEVTAKHTGMAITCDKADEDGLFANLEKSGTLKINVAKLAKQFIVEFTKAQP
jgi:hypothetical protein